MFPEFFTNMRNLFGTDAQDTAVMVRVAEEQRQRLELMAADPLRKPYVNRIQAGERWHDVPSVAYIEPHMPDRSMLDPRSAIIVCKQCDSSIFAVHSGSATTGTPRFP